jgi:rsbT antagonist protein RsbS
MARGIPIVKLYNNLLASIQVELSDHLVAEFKDQVTAEIQRTHARGLIIEISGVDILDSYIARSIRDIAQIARLMGVETVISGLDPAMAFTLVEMDLLLTGVTTALNLESALELLAARQQQEVLDLEALVADTIVADTVAADAFAAEVLEEEV